MTPPPVVVYAAVPGWPGYRVGSDHSIWSRRGGAWRRLRPSLIRGRTPGVWLYRDGRRSGRSVAALVKLAWPEGVPVLGPAARGEANAAAVLSAAAVAELRALRGAEPRRWTHRALAAHYGITRGNVAAVLSGRTWRHVAPAEGGAS